MINIIKGQISTIEGNSAKIIIPETGVVSYKLEITREVIEANLNTPLKPGDWVIAVLYTKTDGVIVGSI